MQGCIGQCVGNTRVSALSMMHLMSHQKYMYMDGARYHVYVYSVCSMFITHYGDTSHVTFTYTGMLHQHDMYIHACTCTCIRISNAFLQVHVQHCKFLKKLREVWHKEKTETLVKGLILNKTKTVIRMKLRSTHI